LPIPNVDGIAIPVGETDFQDSDPAPRTGPETGFREYIKGLERCRRFRDQLACGYTLGRGYEQRSRIKRLDVPPCHIRTHVEGKAPGKSSAMCFRVFSGFRASKRKAADISVRPFK